MPSKSRQLGDRAEMRARRYLRRRLYRIVRTNYQCKFGEIDIIAQRGRVLVFVEVRYRQAAALVSPFESVTAAKRAKLQRTAGHFALQRHYRDLLCRFDLMAVSPKRIEHVKDAFRIGSLLE